MFNIKVTLCLKSLKGRRENAATGICMVKGKVSSEKNMKALTVSLQNWERLKMWKI